MGNEFLESRINKCLAAAKIEKSSQLIISSLGLVALAVKLEKEFHIRFDLDEINTSNFISVEAIKNLIQKKQKIEFTE